MQGDHEEHDEAGPEGPFDRGVGIHRGGKGDAVDQAVQHEPRGRAAPGELAGAAVGDGLTRGAVVAVTVPVSVMRVVVAGGRVERVVVAGLDREPLRDVVVVVGEEAFEEEHDQQAEDEKPHGGADLDRHQRVGEEDEQGDAEHEARHQAAHQLQPGVGQADVDRQPPPEERDQHDGSAVENEAEEGTHQRLRYY